jgi:demethylmenaquinone methyltransferase/2-methoxy-6-polyprenyl-1,4-benzoquinol methylase
VEDDDLLADQRTYYRRRAPEYDEWWQRQGRYDWGEAAAREWQAEVEQVAGVLAAFAPAGDVLELAGGTGWWTARLARTAGSLTVLDSSPEALEVNRQRVEGQDVRYAVADLFTWRPERRYDTVFFSFWLSHVPRHRFPAFWELVASCLRPAGRVFLIDNRLDPSRTAPDPYVTDEADGVQRRRLNDGSDHRVVKVFYEPDALTSRLAELGWRAEMRGTRWFIFGSVNRPPGERQ